MNTSHITNITFLQNLVRSMQKNGKSPDGIEDALEGYRSLFYSHEIGNKWLDSLLKQEIEIVTVGNHSLIGDLVKVGKFELLIKERGKRSSRLTLVFKSNIILIRER